MKISKQTRNLLAYIIGTTIVLIGTVLLVGLAAGWQYNFSTGQIQETGLIIMSSEPSNATISVDGNPLKKRTPFRYTNVLPGNYEVTLKLNNFRPWVRQTSVQAEDVSFDDYAWLIPESIPTRPRYTNEHLTNAVQSIDRKRTIFVAQTPTVTGQAATPAELLVTTDWSKSPTVLYAPSPITTDAHTAAPTQVASFDHLTLSDDGSTLLVRETFVNGQSDYLIMPTSPSDNLRVTNLTSESDQTFDWLEWAPNSNQDLWVSFGGSLQRWSVNNHKLETTGITGVVYANWSQDKLITVETQSDGTHNVVARDNGSLNAPVTVMPIESSPSYHAEYFHWLDHDYLAISSSTSQELWLNRDVFTNRANLISSSLGKSVSQFTVDHSGRYLVFDQNNRFVGINIELNQRYRWQADLTGLVDWQWANDQHLVLETGQQLRLIDFDGQNNELLDSNGTGTSPILFGDNKSLLIFNKPAIDAPPLTQPSLLHLFLNPDKVID